MPESEDIRQLLIGSKLDYFKSKQIVEILKTTEADSKNIFGYYSSQRMKDWQDIVYSYERDYIYLAEIATDLIRETSYEVPGIRRVIQRLHKEKDEAEKEKANLSRRSQQFNSDYQKLAQTYGISGTNVVEELREQSKNLSNVMDELVTLSGGLNESLNFYRDYTKSITKLESSEFLSTLHHVLTYGNTTVYELKYHESPDRVEASEKPAPSSSSGGNPSEIELVNDEIDFGDDVPSSSESSSGFVHVSGKSEDTFVNLEQVVLDPSDKVARGDDAKLVLEFRKTRNQFLNNLYELDAFFKQFSSEEQIESADKFDKRDADQALGIIKKMIDIFNKEKNRVIFQMNDCPSFIDNINEKFLTKLKQSTDNSIKVEQVQDSIRNIEDQIKEAEVQLKKSLIIAKQLQNRVEDSISELYKGRQINIMGCVN